VGRLVKGDIVVVNFPYSDLSKTKKRPALVLAVLNETEVVLCMISGRVRHPHSIVLEEDDFDGIALPKTSTVRYGRLFTSNLNLISYRMTSLKSEKMAQILSGLTGLLSEKERSVS